jgi:hypothetical protein
MLLYWLACCYVLSNLFLVNDWQQFYDAFSMQCTFVPAICALLINSNNRLNGRLNNALKVMCISLLAVPLLLRGEKQGR